MYDKMNDYADEVIRNSREKLDTIKVYKILIDGGLAQNSLEEKSTSCNKRAKHALHE